MFCVSPNKFDKFASLSYFQNLYDFENDINRNLGVIGGDMFKFIRMYYLKKFDKFISEV